jgi:hypothetical protein
MKWEPIETAPKDATSILVYFEGMSTYRVFRIEDNWFIETDRGTEIIDTNGHKALFWMPVPIPEGY